MNHSTSNLEANRQRGNTQVNAQRISILDAAEKVFLQNGLEKTRIIDIAAEAGIAKMSLYRYFPNRDVIAMEIQARMIRKICDLVDPDSLRWSIQEVKKLTQRMIRNFDELRDAYRFMGMFDRLYLDNSADAELTQRTKSWLGALLTNDQYSRDTTFNGVQSSRLLMILSTVIWFLEKLALRGELTWSDQDVPLEMHLKLFEEMITGYIDRYVEA